MEFLRLLEGIRSPFLDTVIGLITQLGEETVGIIVLCAIFWCISKRMAYGIGITYFLSGLTVQGAKILFRIDRPWIADPTLSPVSSALDHATGYSFPSGHAQSAAALFGSLGVQIRKLAARIALFAIAALVAFSRLYLGVHTPLDVGVSLLISAAFIAVAVVIGKGRKANRTKELIISACMTAYAIAVIVIAAILYSQGKIDRVYVSDCLKAAGAGIGFAVGMFIERVYIDFSVKSKNVWWQILKYVAGLAGVMAIKEGLKLVIGTGLAVDTIRYFLMLAWVTVFFPLIIKKFFTYQEPRKKRKNKKKKRKHK